FFSFYFVKIGFYNSVLHLQKACLFRNCSNVITSSFLSALFNFSSFASNDFLVFSNSLIVNFSPFNAFVSSILCIISSICCSKKCLCLSIDIGIFSNCECPITIASKSPVASLEQNLFLLFFENSFLVVTSTFALGYSCKNSFENCSIRWLGTTKRLLV